MRIQLIVILTCLFAWDRRQALEVDKMPQVISSNSTQDYVDTLMVFQNLKPSTAKQLPQLTEDLVKTTLYKYYKKLDCFIEDDYPFVLTDKDHKKNTVKYNLTYFTNLNGDKFPDAIVEYWLMPPGASGRCYQPHKAMIVSGIKEYVFLNPDFVHSFFSIDSVRYANERTFIYGCDYDCGGTDKCKRMVRVEINRTLQ